jgi:hypothetical protein
VISKVQGPSKTSNFYWKFPPVKTNENNSRPLRDGNYFVVGSNFWPNLVEKTRSTSTYGHRTSFHRIFFNIWFLSKIKGLTPVVKSLQLLMWSSFKVSCLGNPNQFIHSFEMTMNGYDENFSLQFAKNLKKTSCIYTDVPDGFFFRAKIGVFLCLLENFWKASC